jgi:hypothetical protein
MDTMADPPTTRKTRIHETRHGPSLGNTPLTHIWGPTHLGRTHGHTHWGDTGAIPKLGRRVPAPEQSATDNARIAEVFPRPSQYRDARSPMRAAADPHVALSL